MRCAIVGLLGTCSSTLDAKPSLTYPDGEVVSSLLQKVINNGGLENVDYFYADGPGSGIDGNSQTPDYNKRYVKPTQVKNILQQLVGYGAEENIQHIIAALSGTRKWWPNQAHDKIPPNQAQLDEIEKIINDIGDISELTFVAWSRGAAAAISSANQLGELIEDLKIRQQKGQTLTPAELRLIKINNIKICAIDPVPGFGNCDLNRRKLHPIVSEFLGIYAANEFSAGFSPVCPKVVDPEKTKTRFVLLPGYHAGLVGNYGAHPGAKAEKELKGVSTIVRHLVMEFCLQGLKNGNARSQQLLHSNDNWLLSDEELLNTYEQIKADLSYYEKLKQSAYTITQRFKSSRKATEGNNYIFNINLSQTAEFQDQYQVLRAKKYINAQHKELAERLQKRKSIKIDEFIPITDDSEEIELAIAEVAIQKEPEEIQQVEDEIIKEEIALTEAETALTNEIKNIQEEETDLQLADEAIKQEQAALDREEQAILDAETEAKLQNEFDKAEAELKGSLDKVIAELKGKKIENFCHSYKNNMLNTAKTLSLDISQCIKDYTREQKTAFFQQLPLNIRSIFNHNTNTFSQDEKALKKISLAIELTAYLKTLEQEQINRSHQRFSFFREKIRNLFYYNKENKRLTAKAMITALGNNQPALSHSQQKALYDGRLGKIISQQQYDDIIPENYRNYRPKSMGVLLP